VNSNTIFHRSGALAAIALAALLTASAHAHQDPQTTVAADFTAAERGTLLDGVASAMGVYIYPDVADAVRAKLNSQRSSLVAIADPVEFAKSVSAVLHTTGNDKHLNLYYSAEPIQDDHDPTPAQIAHDEKSDVLHNAGVRIAQWLPGNIGYIRILSFPSDAPGVRRAIDAAMATVAHTDALIIDLRHNGGGDPSSLDYWMGYFFAKPTELTSIHWTTPKPHVDRQFSAASVAGPIYDKPLYVLTSSKTFSCAEQFTYDLKALHRASIVGETTGGGANPGDFHRLNSHFAVFIPTGRAYNPYTKTNWEHTGISPDVSATVSDALVRAYTLALQRDTNAFDELVVERQELLKDPGGAIARAFTP
jgi:hypothetical protein